jgi:hypothetical protein
MRALGLVLIALVAGAILGVGTALGGKFLEAHGPSVGPLAFNGNGALVVPCCGAPLLLTRGVLLLGLRRAWVATGLSVLGFLIAYTPVSSIALSAAP